MGADKYKTDGRQGRGGKKCELVDKSSVKAAETVDIISSLDLFHGVLNKLTGQIRSP